MSQTYKCSGARKEKGDLMIYLDNAATTEPSPDVLESMKPYLSYEYGNPGSIHYLGVRAAKAVSKARPSVHKL